MRGILLIIVFASVTVTGFGQFKLYEKGHDSYVAGKYDEAIKLFSEYLTKPTRDKNLDVEVFYLRGLSYFKKADHSKAISDFEECLLRNHNNKGNIHWFKAKSHAALGTYPDAISEYTSAINVLGEDKATKSKLLYERGVMYKKSSQFDLATDDFQHGLALTPGNADIKKELDSIDPTVVASRSALRKTETPAQTNNPPQQNTTPLQEKKTEGPQNNSTSQKNTSLAEKKKEDTPTQQANKPSSQKPDSSKDVAKDASDKKSDSKDKTAETNVATQTPSNVNQPTGEKKTYLLDKLQAKLKKDNTDASTTPANPPAQQVATSPTPAQAATPLTLADLYKDEKRYALIIGNSAYPKAIGVLRNPVNDATDLAKELQASNFEVQLLTNATYGQMRAAMLKFKEKIDAGEKDKTVSLFYFAGHGVQYEDENYLVPIDAMIEYQDDISRYCFGVQKMVLSNMERSNSRMNIVILDACRNNPFPAATRSAGGQGLGEMRRARGSFIAYATAPGSVASDGAGRNGLYTQELLKAMRKPGLTIEQVFKEVRANVLKLSGDKQNTWDSSNIVGEFYFKF